MLASDAAAHKADLSWTRLSRYANRPPAARSRAFDTSARCGHNDYMARNVVGARELKTRLGTYLQQVREGRTLVVTDRGEPVAELRPLPTDESLPSALLKLSTKGTVTLPTRDGLPAFRPIRSPGASIADAVGEDREDRF